MQLSIAYEPSQASAPCTCGCGGRLVSLTRFLHLDGVPRAVYYARYADSHPERVLASTLSIGQWEEGTLPEQRVAFAIEMRAQGEEYQFALVDAALSPWQDLAVIGRTLDRAEAMEHPLRDEVFELASQLVDKDVALRKYLLAE